MNPDPLRAKAAFGVLPNELKARVLQLVAWQELAWRVRVEGLSARTKTAEKDKHVDGLAAASLVSKEWRALAVPYLFDSFTSERAYAPLFRHLVLRCHSHLFSRACLESGACSIKWQHTFSLLPLLPRLRALELSCAAAKDLFGEDLNFDPEAEHDDEERDEEEELRINTMRQLASTIDDLTLDGFNVEEAARILGFWSGLRRLNLQNLAPIADGAFSQVVAGLRGKMDLIDLKIHFRETEPPAEAPVPAKWTSDAIASLRDDPPPLSSLHLTSHAHHPQDLDLISAFSPTLTHLHITFDRYHLADLNEPEALPAPLDFPLLTALSLRNTASELGCAFRTLLPAFNSSPVIHLCLQDEGINLGHPDIGTLSYSPLHILSNNLPSLRHLEILHPTQGPLEAAEISIIAAFCTERGLPQPTHTPFDHAEFKHTFKSDDIGMLCNGMDQVLDFGKREVERVRAGGTVLGAVELLEALRPLDGRRRAWLD